LGPWIASKKVSKCLIATKVIFYSLNVFYVSSFAAKETKIVLHRWQALFSTKFIFTERPTTLLVSVKRCVASRFIGLQKYDATMENGRHRFVRGTPGSALQSLKVFGAYQL